MNTRTQSLALAVITLAAMTAGASADSIHLDFGTVGMTGTAGIDSPAEAAGAVANAMYTHVDGEGTFAGVTLDFGTGSSGDATDIDFSNGVQFITAGASIPSFYNNSLLGDQVTRASGGTNVAIGLKVSGLAVGTYNFYLTAFRSGGGSENYSYDTRATVSGSAVSDFSALTPNVITNAGSGSVSSFIEDTNYVVHSLTIDASNPDAYIYVFGKKTDGSDYIGVINSLEIVPVPEPSSMALLGIGGLVGLARRRRRG